MTLDSLSTRSYPAISSRCFAFPSALGWCAVRGVGGVISRLSLAHRTRQAALDSIGTGRVEAVKDLESDAWCGELAEKISLYLNGVYVDFSGVRVDLGPRSRFAAEVLEACRRIPCGETVTYGELARVCGSPRAARAVGSCMAKNPVPLIIPCHRVVCSGGSPGHYSAPGGADTKRRLLRIEAAMATLAQRDECARILA